MQKSTNLFELNVSNIAVIRVSVLRKSCWKRDPRVTQTQGSPWSSGVLKLGGPKGARKSDPVLMGPKKTYQS